MQRLHNSPRLAAELTTDWTGARNSPRNRGLLTTSPDPPGSWRTDRQGPRTSAARRARRSLLDVPCRLRTLLAGARPRHPSDRAFVAAQPSGVGGRFALRSLRCASPTPSRYKLRTRRIACVVALLHAHPRTLRTGQASWWTGPIPGGTGQVRRGENRCKHQSPRVTTAGVAPTYRPLRRPHPLAAVWAVYAAAMGLDLMAFMALGAVERCPHRQPD